MIKTGFIEGLVVTVTITGVLLFAVWQMATAIVVPETKTLQDQVTFLSGELETLKNRMEQSRARQVVLEQEADVLRQANRLLRELESQRQTEMGSMQSELDFFRRLAGTGGAQSGLDIYRVEVISTESDRVFRFILTLTQNIRRASIISGRSWIDIEGTLNDRPVKLEWPDISEGKNDGPKFRFKYFQQLEGYMSLPEGFSPTRLAVTLEPGGQHKPITRNYNWNELQDH